MEKLSLLKYQNQQKKSLVLLVDFDPKNYQSLKSALKKINIFFEKASGFREAEKKIQENNYHLFILNVQLQGLNYFNFTDFFKSNYKSKDVPVIVIINDKKEKVNVLKMFDPDSVDYIIKPFDNDTLIAKVITSLKSYHQKKEMRKSEKNLEVFNSQLTNLVKEQTTELLELHQINKKILETINQIFYIFQKGKTVNDHKFIFLSHQTQNILGFPVFHFTGNFNNWLELIHPEDKPGYLNVLDCIEHSSGNSVIIYRMMHEKTKKYLWIEDNMAPERNADLSAALIYGAITDISNRKEIENEKKVLMDQLQQSQKMEALGLLAIGIAHDFNNYLTAVIGNIRLIKSKLANPEAVINVMNRIEKISKNSTNMINELLHFSKSFSQKNDFSYINLNEIIKNVINILSPSIDERIKISLTLTDGLPFIKGIDSQVEQIGFNLLTNAIYAVTQSLYRKDSGIIEIKTLLLAEDEILINRYLNKNNKYVCLSVSDSGNGVPLRYKKKIFEPFFTTKGEKNGSGLGLFMINQIVKGMHGSVKLYRNLYGGAYFKIYLPVC